jgi:hypothetical protein
MDYQGMFDDRGGDGWDCVCFDEIRG